VALAIIKNKQTSSIIVLIISIFCHVAAFLQFQLKLDTFGQAGDLSVQVYVSLGISLVLSFLIFFLTKHIFFILTLLLRFIIIPIIGRPLGGYMGIELVLMVSLILETCTYEPFPNSALLSIGFLFLEAAVKFFYNSKNYELTHNIICFLLFGLIMIYIIILSIYYREQLVDKERLIRRLDITVMNLTKANAGFQQYASIAEIKAYTDERNRITRELHDELGYTLTNLIMMMEAGAVFLKNEDRNELNNLFTEARFLAENALEETRKTLHFLRQEEKPTAHGPGAIQELVDVFAESTQIEVNVHYGNLSWSFGERIDSAIRRFIQEGMTNAFRHGKATKITIYFWQTEKAIEISIRDNGAGAVEIKEGIGMIGMKERMEKLSGSVLAYNVVDGFELFASIPFKEQISYG
jgi:signal transduction histidine kinase